VVDGGRKIRLLEDDFCGDYAKGDVFETYYDEEFEEECFRDAAGDARPVDGKEYEVIN